jgi:hypothetical protein
MHEHGVEQVSMMHVSTVAGWLWQYLAPCWVGAVLCWCCAVLCCAGAVPCYAVLGCAVMCFAGAGKTVEHTDWCAFGVDVAGTNLRRDFINITHPAQCDEICKNTTGCTMW